MEPDVTPSAAPSEVASPPHPRLRIAASLTGDVLEVGPGSHPFPVGEGARVTYADKSVPGGRDATWPELVGEPWGPEADLHVDLDAGLVGVEDRSFDAVIASHVIEHVAEPVGAVRELCRVLRPGGRLVLVVPDRSLTFDRVRPATSLAHLLDEHERGVVEVDDDHIREFCAAIWSQEPIHPPEVRDWHDPAGLDPGRMELHRRRSIHVHVWDPEGFATLVVALVAEGMVALRLTDLYLDEDTDEPGIEFGLVLERLERTATDPLDLARELAQRWAELVLSEDRRSPARVAGLVRWLWQGAEAVPALGEAADAVLDVLAGAVVSARSERDAEHAAALRTSALLDHVVVERDDARSEAEAARHSASYRLGSAALVPLRGARRLARRGR